MDLEELEGAIEFDDVWFKYQTDWILKGVSFTVKQGETVAIVGPTGAGKSSIVQLLPRLYDIQKGGKHQWSIAEGLYPKIVAREDGLCAAEAPPISGYCS